MPSLDSLKCRRSLEVAGKTYHYYSLPDAAAQLGDISRLPTSLKVLLENLLRWEDDVTVRSDDLRSLVSWLQTRSSDQEIQYRPARVLMQDFTGVPAVVDLAAMRDAVAAVCDLRPGTGLVAAFAPFALLAPAMGAASVRVSGIGTDRAPFRTEHDPANPAESGVIGEVDNGWRVAMATAANERGLSLRSPGRFLATADRLLALNASPGGAADLLAACLFLDRLPAVSGGWAGSL